MPKTFVQVRFQSEYYHKWKNATAIFLSNIHRHMLHIQVDLQVFHDDREVEIIQLRKNIKDTFEAIRDDKYSLDEEAPLALLDACELIVLRQASCETIAYALGVLTLLSYSQLRDCRVTVLEDGENGATWEAS